MDCANYCSRRESGDRDLYDTTTKIHEAAQVDMSTPVGDKGAAPAASPPPPVAPISAAPAENASTVPKQALARAKTGKAPLVQIKNRPKQKIHEGQHLNASNFMKMYTELKTRTITVTVEKNGEKVDEERDLFQAAKEEDKEKRDKWVKKLLDKYQEKHPGDAAVLDDKNHPADHYAMKHCPEPKEGDAAKLLQDAVGKHIVGFANAGKFEDLLNILGSYIGAGRIANVVRFAKTKDPHGWTIVHLLARDRSNSAYAARTLNALLKQDKKLADVKDDYLGFTALHHAIANHSLNGVKACLEYKTEHSLYIQEDLENGDALNVAEEYGTRIGEQWKSGAESKDGQCEADHEEHGKEILELVTKEYNKDERIAYRQRDEKSREQIGKGESPEQL